MDGFEGFDTELWKFFTKELYIWEKEDIEKVMGIKSVVSSDFTKNSAKELRLLGVEKLEVLPVRI